MATGHWPAVLSAQQCVGAMWQEYLSASKKSVSLTLQVHDNTICKISIPLEGISL